MEIVLENRVRPPRLPKLPQDLNARDRVRIAIKNRLLELGMTGRAFGRAFSANEGKGHVDTWVSSLLKGQFALSLDELDEAARILKLHASDLVRTPYEQAHFLTADEDELIQDFRQLPTAIRRHLVTLTQYLRGVVPEEIDFLDEYRELTDDERAKVQHWTRALLIARAPVPGLAILPDLPMTTAPPTAQGSRTRARKRKNG